MSDIEAERVYIFDTTLRDGEQSPGCSMNLEEKLKIAALLDEMGVDIIEAGFPMASKGDFESVNAIAKIVKNATVCGLSRAIKRDIEVCAEAIEPAAHRRIHTFISTSPLHMKHKLQMDEDTVIEAIRESVSSPMMSNGLPKMAAAPRTISFAVPLKRLLMRAHAQLISLILSATQHQLIIAR